MKRYLKEFVQLENIRYRIRKRTKVHFDFVTLMCILWILAGLYHVIRIESI